VNDTTTRSLIRDELVRAVDADIRRPRRRRRRHAVIGTALTAGALGLGTVGAAATGSAWFGPPASDAAQDTFDGLSRQGMPGLGTVPPGRGIELARSDGLALHGTQTADGGWCLTSDRGEMTCRTGSADEEPLWFSVSGNEQLRDIPGKPDQPFTVTLIGRVRAPGATTVEIGMPDGNPPIRIEVGRHGFFIADLPEEVFRQLPADGRWPPAIARDVTGAVVASSS
jgi:hypothetical protein